jgi:hypothetical protein
MDVPEPAGRELRLRLELDRTGVLRIHAPVCRVHVVGAPAGDHAGRELLATQPAGSGIDAVLRVHPVFRVRHERRGAEPPVIIEVRWHRLRFGDTARRIAWQPHLDRPQVADASVPNGLAGSLELRPRSGRPLLAADREDGSHPVQEVAHDAAFRHRQ